MPTNVLAVSRRNRMLEMIENGRELSVSAIAAEFDVATETVRRDLKELERQGLVRRVYGGGVPVGRPSPPLSEREVENPDGKAAIARIVLEAITPDLTIYMGAGSTMLAVAKAMAAGPRVTVLTHMPRIAEVMGEAMRHEVSLTGGFYRHEHRALTGAAVPSAIADRVFDVAIMGAYGLDLDFGLVDDAEDVFNLKRGLKHCSRRCIWVADQSKFGRSGRFRTMSLDQLDVLVTDRPPADPYLNALTDAGVEVVWPNMPTPPSLLPPKPTP